MKKPEKKPEIILKFSRDSNQKEVLDIRIQKLTEEEFKSLHEHIIAVFPAKVIFGERDKNMSPQKKRAYYIDVLIDNKAQLKRAFKILGTQRIRYDSKMVNIDVLEELDIKPEKKIALQKKEELPASSIVVLPKIDGAYIQPGFVR